MKSKFDRDTVAFFLYLACSIGLMGKVMFELSDKDRPWRGLITLGLALGFCLVGYLVGFDRGFNRGRDSVKLKEK